jgi:hypothetical protein
MQQVVGQDVDMAIPKTRSDDMPASIDDDCASWNLRFRCRTHCRDATVVDDKHSILDGTGGGRWIDLCSDDREIGRVRSHTQCRSANGNSKADGETGKSI